MSTNKGYVVVLSSGSNTREIGLDDVENPDLPSDHTQTNEWRFETPADETLEQYRHGEASIYFERDGARTLIRRGPIDRIATSDGKTRLRGRDILARLDEDGPSTGEFVADGPAVDEIQRLWDQSQFDGTVIEPEPEIIRDDEVVLTVDS